jgi:tetratricopeptide (TPR) repeat protein
MASFIGQYVRRILACTGVCLGLAASSSLLHAADWEETFAIYRAGNYAQALDQCQEALEKRFRNEDWWWLSFQSQLALGRYEAFQQGLTNALARVPSSVRVRSFAAAWMQQFGETARAEALLAQINDLVTARAWDYQDAQNLVALGRAALLMGADPKVVLERFLEVAKRRSPEHRDAYLVSGQLALDKHDYALAATFYIEGLKRFPDDPDFHFGLARSLAPNQRSAASQSLQKALDANPRHTQSLLMVADNAIDAEEYRAAQEMLDKVFAVNPHDPEAWALQAVLRHLANDAPGATQARAQGVRHWPKHPGVDHLIGLKLSQKYRFEEGAAFQRQALAQVPQFTPAKIQLVQDLLRLGQDAEGWELVKEVRQQDAYDITTFNLVTLQQTLGKFRVLTNGHLVVRMEAREAELYGDRVLRHLQEARDTLGRKYQVTLDQPTLVEIYPEQKDFAVRTFGMPHNPGFLGVCFGDVITANSPASQGGNPVNWRAVLWHEMCHVMTLHLTRNKMPRWLSEGISVYEEKQANPAWGQAMNPYYRDRILQGEFTPLSKLSGAFLTAKDNRATQFAYYQSYLAVEFLVERFGHDRLLDLLRDLGEGLEVNAAIAKLLPGADTLDRDYAEFVRQHAASVSPGLDWRAPDPLPPEDDAGALAAFLGKNPTNLWALTAYTKTLLADKRWKEAVASARKLTELHPGDTSPDNGLRLLARAYRGLNRPAEERSALERLAAQDADDLESFLRMTELAEADEDWTAAVASAELTLSVNPLLPQPHRTLARAGETLGDLPHAAESWQRLLLLDPHDPAEARFRLASIWAKLGDSRARRLTIEALEDAPRYLDAHRLLLRLETAGSPPIRSEPPSPPAPEGLVP